MCILFVCLSELSLNFSDSDSFVLQLPVERQEIWKICLEKTPEEWDFSNFDSDHFAGNMETNPLLEHNTKRINLMKVSACV